MKNNNFSCFPFFGVFAVGFTSVFSMAFGQDTGTTTLEEITVTAQRREASLQDTALAVTALTGDDLGRAGVMDIHDLGVVVPNTHVTESVARDTVFVTIRGIAQRNTGTSSDPTTAFHIDGAYVPRMSGVKANFFDLERLEVLRGPQGTLYGRNSTAGVINLITNKPNPSAMDANFEIDAGDYNFREVEGMLNVPLSDSAAGRLAFVKSDRGGYRDNGPLVAAGDDSDELGVRGQVLWDIGENTSILVSADHYKKQGVGNIIQNFGCGGESRNQPGVTIACNRPVADDVLNTPMNTEGFRDYEDLNFKVELNHDFGNHRLVYLGSTRDHVVSLLNDIDGGIDIYTARGVAFDSSNIHAPTITSESKDSKSRTHELRLVSALDGQFNYQAGVFYIEDEVESDFAFITSRENFSSRAPIGTFFLNDSVNYAAESVAGFFNGRLDISDQTTLVAGVRYTKDEKRLIGDRANPLAGSHRRIGCIPLARSRPVFPPMGGFCPGGAAPLANVQNGVFAIIPAVASREWEETTWEIGIDHYLRDDSLLYGKVSTGYKAGGFDFGSLNRSTGELNFYNPEKLLAYEVGHKTDFLNGLARLNGAAFFYQYSDNQQSVVRPLNGVATVVTVNAAEASLYGFELEGTVLFGNTGGMVNINFGYIKTEFDEFSDVDETMTPGIIETLDMSGHEMINSPEINTTVTLIPTTFEVLNGTMSPRLQFRYASDSWLRVHSEAWDKSESYTRTDVSLRYESGRGNWYAEAWLRNLEDDAVKTFSVCTGNSRNSIGCSALYMPPRTFGLTIGYRM